MSLLGLRIWSLACAALMACLVSPARGWPVLWGWSRNFEQRNFKTVSRIYNLTVYPNQLPIFTSGAAGVPAGLFSKDVVGRVAPVGRIVGIPGTIESILAQDAQ